MAIILLLLILLIVILVVIFALQNAAVVPISYLFWDLEGSLALILLLALVIGAIIGLLVAVPTFIKNRRRISKQEKEIDELEASIQEHTTKLEMIEQQLEEQAQLEAPEIEVAAVEDFTAAEHTEVEETAREESVLADAEDAGTSAEKDTEADEDGITQSPEPVNEIESTETSVESDENSPERGGEEI